MLVGQQFQQNSPKFHYICLYPHNCKLFSTTRPFSVGFGGLFIHTTCWNLRIHIVIKSFCIIYYPHSSTHYWGSQIYNLQDLLFVHFGYSQPTHEGSNFIIFHCCYINYIRHQNGSYYTYYNTLKYCLSEGVADSVAELSSLPPFGSLPTSGDMYVYRVIYRHMSAIYNVSFAVYFLFSEIIGKSWKGKRLFMPLTQCAATPPRHLWVAKPLTDPYIWNLRHMHKTTSKLKRPCAHCAFSPSKKRWHFTVISSTLTNKRFGFL